MECVIPLMIVSERNSAILPTGISTEGTGIGEAGAMARAHRVTPLMVGLVHGGPFSWGNQMNLDSIPLKACTRTSVKLPISL